MSELSSPSPNLTWIVEQWLDKLKDVLESMTEERCSYLWAMESEEPLGSNPLLVEQKLGPADQPVLWVGLPDAVWRGIGKRVLSSAGVDSGDDDEIRNTALEVIQQSIGGAAEALGARLGLSVSRGACQTPPSFPADLPVSKISLRFTDGPLPPLWISLSPEVESWFANEAPTVDSSIPDSLDSLQAVASAGSKTYDLLLDVALPVSVSFGKTEMIVKDVLKLTTGSIVELNRAVSEPVEVIVNGCVIARGEVVVVDGNYGVRIQKIASRQERLRTGAKGVETL